MITLKFFVHSYLNCTRCVLHQYRTNIVFGRGTLPADILFIGEAPGKIEDLQGEAFVGQSGKLLNLALDYSQEQIGMKLSYFITNTAACRPCDARSGPNLQPSPETLLACWDRLKETVERVQPIQIILLGEVAKKVCRKVYPGSMCLQHPAFILRKGGVESPYFRKFVTDLIAILERVKERKASHGR